MTRFVRSIMAVLSAVLLTIGMVSVGTANAGGPSCPADKVFAVGGFNDPKAGGFAVHGDHVVAYSANLNAMEEGIGALKRDVDAFRANCPGSRVVVTGHSQGAAIAHVYLSRHGSGLRNAAAVLYSDPKQAHSGEANGLFLLGGAPIAGTDANFGGVPTVSLCRHRDVICNRGAGWGPYLFEGVHGQYDFNARLHAGKTGVIWLP